MASRDSRITAGFVMAMGLSCHFFGYECARAASISLLAAKVTPPLSLSLLLFFVHFPMIPGDAVYRHARFKNVFIHSLFLLSFVLYFLMESS